jgi:hypothetical protein
MPILHKGVYQKTFIASTVPRNMQTMTRVVEQSAIAAHLEEAIAPKGAQKSAIAHEFGSLP